MDQSKFHAPYMAMSSHRLHDKINGFLDTLMLVASDDEHTALTKAEVAMVESSHVFSVFEQWCIRQSVRNYYINAVD